MKTQLVYRTMHSGDLRSLARGKDAAGKTIRRSRVVADEAKKHLARRREGQRIVHSVLSACGLVYTGTAGWHVTAYITPDMTVGLVDIARGIAVEATGVKMSPEIIEALTIPDQAEGCLASGAAAWTSPDAGVAELVATSEGGRSLMLCVTGRRPSAPDGWKQLLVDVRWGGEELLPLPDANLRLHSIGYQTCYGDTRRPCRSIDRTDDRDNPQWWPFDDQQMVRVRAARDEWLRRECRRIKADWQGERVNCYPDQEARDWACNEAAAKSNDIDWWTAQAARHAKTVCLGRHGAYSAQVIGYDSPRTTEDWSGEPIGGRILDDLEGILTRSVFKKIRPICQLLADLLGSWPENYDRAKRYSHSAREQILTALKGVAVEMAEHELSGMSGRSSAYLDSMCEILYEGGPVEVHQPCNPRL